MSTNTPTAKPTTISTKHNQHPWPQSKISNLLNPPLFTILLLIVPVGRIKSSRLLRCSSGGKIKRINMGWSSLPTTLPPLSCWEIRIKPKTKRMLRKRWDWEVTKNTGTAKYNAGIASSSKMSSAWPKGEHPATPNGHHKDPHLCWDRTRQNRNGRKGWTPGTRTKNACHSETQWLDLLTGYRTSF